MNNPILVSHKDRWQIWAGIGGAIFIHLAAVALAETRTIPRAPIIVEPESTIGLEILAPPDEPPATPDVAIPAPPNPPDEPLFIEPQSTPAPKRLTELRPVTRPSFSGPPKPATMRAAKVYALYAPRPVYPYEARRRGLTGSGVAVLNVDPATGSVTSVSMAVSIGDPILDNATISAFRAWRFKPGTISTVRTPITYELTGASY